MHSPRGIALLCSGNCSPWLWTPPRSVGRALRRANCGNDAYPELAISSSTCIPIESKFRARLRVIEPGGNGAAVGGKFGGFSPPASVLGEADPRAPLIRIGTTTIRSGVPLRCNKSGPLDRDRVVQVRSGRIKSTPSDRDPVPLIAYRFAAR